MTKEEFCGAAIAMKNIVFPALLLKAQALMGSDKLTNGQQSSERSSSCSSSINESNAGIERLRKAASREESISNYLYCPQAMDVEKTDIKHFQWHLSNGDPVIVSNVLDGALGFKLGTYSYGACFPPICK